ncbi:RHS repeat-associated core domain-containing protein [Ekhidna sp.]
MPEFFYSIALGDLLEQSANDAVVNVEGSALSNAVGQDIANILAGVATSSNQPKAYLQYILFDEQFNVVADNYIPYENGVDVGNNWKQLVLTDEVYEDGYLYAYVVNESDKDIFFDDFTFQILGTRAIKKTDYYPFGLTFNERTRVASTRVLMNTFQNQETDDATGWVKFKWRNHDPTIGRFFNVDPIAEDYVYNSPYAFSENNVTGHVELEGLEKADVKDGKIVVGPISSDAVAARSVGKDHQAILSVKPQPSNSPLRKQMTIGIGRNDINHPNAFSDHDRAGHLGVEIGEAATGIAALKNLPKLAKHAPGLLKSIFKSGTTKIDDAAAGAMKNYDNIDEVWTGCDCSEIAEDIFTQTNGGNVLELTGEGGVKVLQNGVEETFDYHQVFVKDGYVYDPRYSADPVLYDDYMKQINKSNGNGVNVNDVIPDQ